MSSERRLRPTSPLVLVAAIPAFIACAALIAALARHSDAPRSQPAPTVAAPTVPAPRGNPAIGWDPVHRQLVVFGGFGVVSPVRGDFLHDTWVWDGRRWARIAVAGPSARVGAVMTWDVAGKRFLLDGGYSAGGAGPLSDTWAWDGTAWASVPVAVEPASLLLPAMASEARGDRVLLITRDTAETSLTWRWDGSSWTVASRQSPPLNSTAVVATTGPGGAVVLVDFSGAQQGDGGETWTWDGGTWTRHAGGGPPVFDALSAVMAGDPASGDVVLFESPGLPSTASGATWTWDGLSWTKAPPSGPATAAGMVTDTGDGHALLVGGPVRGDLTELWEWRSGRWQRLSP